MFCVKRATKSKSHSHDMKEDNKSKLSFSNLKFLGTNTCTYFHLSKTWDELLKIDRKTSMMMMKIKWVKIQWLFWKMSWKKYTEKNLKIFRWETWDNTRQIYLLHLHLNISHTKYKNDRKKCQSDDAYEEFLDWKDDTSHLICSFIQILFWKNTSQNHPLFHFKESINVHVDKE
jgi:hypothetical protein